MATVSKPAPLKPDIPTVVYKPSQLAQMTPADQLAYLSARVASPVQRAAMAGSTAEAMVEEKEDKARPAMPGSRRTRKRAQFGVGYNTGVSI